MSNRGRQGDPQGKATSGVTQAEGFRGWPAAHRPGDAHRLATPAAQGRRDPPRSAGAWALHPTLRHATPCCWLLPAVTARQAQGIAHRKEYRATQAFRLPGSRALAVRHATRRHSRGRRTLHELTAVGVAAVADRGAIRYALAECQCPSGPRLPPLVRAHRQEGGVIRPRRGTGSMCPLCGPTSTAAARWLSSGGPPDAPCQIAAGSPRRGDLLGSRLNGDAFAGAVEDDRAPLPDTST